ncbi:UDP-N-acetylmuramoyl-L-alanine--D-glutamate ligase [Selenihalanaerobacter shriftii]|uniref:UDP-N-acetylmuramoylalanine--D-glutamate ligase n=1 Tax=Selenihalanaerobacter shriftii TaxID=142842 RepID=A0A1T4JZD5_9FIRM|nr:UDP-N-acetylmuramoyl-L-alanine--D-glutamate ligase [Selenihalanaerobacter shriftii]SJZ35521.1 UDP-N-acetylmuramoylalanine--D-glutamate ligase [Selenihalanaerobacter shriftii]
MDLVEKKVTVLGLGKRTGIATVKFLINKGANVVVSDVKSETELKEELMELNDYEIEYDLDGHSDKAINNTDMIVISPGVPSQISILQKAKRLGIPVISAIELAYHFCAAPIVAITGTNGKTTTTTLTGEIFNATQDEVVVGGNIGRPLIRDVNNLSSKGAVIAEISSFQLENIEEFRPKISLILNLTPDHLDRHGSFEDYIEAKKKIFSNQQGTDYTILNYDDPVTRELADDTHGTVVYFSQKEEVEYGLYIENGEVINNLTAEKEIFIEVDEIGIKGPHNLENALGAISIALLSDIEPEIIKDVVREFNGVEHRIEDVAVIDKVRYVNDSKATNPVSAMKALETFSEPLILIAGGMDKKSDFSEFADKVAENVKVLILLGETADEIEQSMKSLGFNAIKRINTIEDAVKVAVDISIAGDLVLLSPACASWDMFSSYKERGQKFKKAVFDLRRQ